MYVIGVDGGATKTIAVLVDKSTKKEVVSFSTGSSNKNSVGNETAKKNIIDAIKGAIEKGKIDLSQGNFYYKFIKLVESICLGLSGVDRPEDKKLVFEWMKEFSENIKIRIESDPYTNLSSGTLGKLNGMIIISGTGSVVLGTDGKRNERAGGWVNFMKLIQGPLLGDSGNGWSIGHEVLVYVAKNTDGIEPDSILVKALLDELKLEKPQDIINWIYSDLSWARVANLAPILLKCCEKGDFVSKKILESQVNGLIDCAKSVANKFQWTKNEFTLVLCGSLATTKGPFQDLILEKLKNEFPKSNITFPKVTPEMGAALLVLN